MSIILYNILVAVVGLAMSPFITALIERYSEEKKIFTKEFWNDVKFDTKVAVSISIAFIVLLFVFGPGVDFVINAFVTILLIISFFVDLKAQIIPNETNFIGFLVGIVLAFVKFTIDGALGLNAIIGMIAGAGIFLLIALFSLLVYKKVGMGLGDVKLMGMLGLFFGFANTVQIFVLSFLIGAIISIFLLVTKIKKSDEYIPFGPFIVMASFITMIIPASTMVNWLLTVI